MAEKKNQARLRDRFQKEVAPALMKEFELKNPMAVPRLHKIVGNMGLGEATENAKVIDPAAAELGEITAQMPLLTRAKKTSAASEVRAGVPTGAMVTLRVDRVYVLLDGLMNAALHPLRDL